MTTKRPPYKMLNIKTLTHKIGGRWSGGHTHVRFTKNKMNLRELYFLLTT